MQQPQQPRPEWANIEQRSTISYCTRLRLELTCCMCLPALNDPQATIEIHGFRQDTTLFMSLAIEAHMQTCSQLVVFLHCCRLFSVSLTDTRVALKRLRLLHRTLSHAIIMVYNLLCSCEGRGLQHINTAGQPSWTHFTAHNGLMS